jgi:hypothetical protein
MIRMAFFVLIFVESLDTELDAILEDLSALGNQVENELKNAQAAATASGNNHLGLRNLNYALGEVVFSRRCFVVG